MLRLKSQAAMFALVIGLLIAFTQTSRAESWSWKNLFSFGSSENAAAVCTTDPVVVNDLDSGAGSLRQAVIDACPGSTITFSNAVNGISLSTGQITIDKNLTIQGPGANLLTVQNSLLTFNRVFLVNSGVTATLAGLTVTGGRLAHFPPIEPGAGISNQGSLTVRDSTITGNLNQFRGVSGVPRGGGIYNAPGANLTVANSTISNNIAEGSGGGIFNDSGTVTITKSIITGNQLTFNRGGGGGISNYGGVVTVTDTTVSHNRSGQTGPSGGGIMNDNGGTITLTNSTVSSNRAELVALPGGGGGGGGGGPIEELGIRYAEEETVPDSTTSHNLSKKNKPGGGSLKNNDDKIMETSLSVACTGANSSSSLSHGGGIANVCGTVNLINSTIVNNAAPGGLGGNIYNGSSATVNSRNSIIAGSGPDYFGTLTSQGYNLIGSDTDTTITGDTTGNIVGTGAAPINPLLAALGDNGGPTNTHALLTGSPAINAGSNALAVDKDGNPLTTDQRGTGFPRIVGASADIGAFELNVSTPTPTPTPTPNTAPTASATPNPATTNEDTAVQITLTGTDADDDNLTFAITQQPTGGTLGSISAPNCSAVNTCTANVTYTPSLNFNGADSFKFQVNDGTTDSAEATVSINVTAVDDTAYVVNTTADPGTGGCDAAECTLREAITEANADAGAETITFQIPNTDTGCISGVCTINLTSALPALSTSMTIQGTGANALTVRRSAAAGTPEFRIFLISSGASVAINDLTVSHGVAVDSGIFGQPTTTGGGIMSRDTNTVTALTRVVVSNNSAPTLGSVGGRAGGVYNISNAQMTITDSVVTGNTATSVGGGIENSAALTVRGSTISNNSGRSGGGIINFGTTTVTNSTISNNNASLFGGGIINLGTTTVTNSTLSGNVGVYGGAFNNGGTLNVIGSAVTGNTANGDSDTSGGIDNSGPVTVTNSTLSGNFANGAGGSNGGAIWAGAEIVTLTNSTITNNTAAGPNSASGVIRVDGTVTARNTIIAANVNNAATPDTAGESFTSQGYNLVGNPGAVTAFNQTGDQTGSSTTPLDPKLGPLASNGGPTQTHALLACSRAIDNGDDGSASPATDQRGSPRPFDIPNVTPVTAGGDNSDIGAFESQDTAPAACNTAPSASAVPNPATTNEDTAVQITMTGTDSDDDALTFQITQQPNNGTLGSISAPNCSAVNTCTATVTYTPHANYSGADSFKFKVNDGTADSAEVTVQINVTNTPPTITPASGLSRQQSSVASNSPIATVGDTQSGAGAVTVTVTSANPSNGVTISNIQNTNGAITANISASCSATNVTFTLQASDGNSTATATLNVTVTANSAPVLTYSSANLNLNGATSITSVTGPIDSGGVSAISVLSTGTYTGTIGVDATTGTVSLSNATPAGTHTIVIRAVDNCDAITDASFTLSVSKGDQTITFNALPAKTYGDAPFTVGAAGGASGNPVNFSSQTPTVCTVGTNTVTIVSIGTCTIRASQAGNSDYNAAPDVDRSFTVNKASATVTLSNLSHTFDGAAKSATATTNPADKTVVITYSQSGNAVASPTNAGSYDVSAAINDANYQGSTTGTLVIGKGEQTITFSALSAKTYGDAPFTVSATGGVSGNAVTFGSQTTSVCTVSGNTVTIVSAGTCTIRASQAGNSNYNAATDVDQSFTVNKATPVITWNNPADITYGTALSGTQLDATASVAGSFGYTPPAATVLPAGANQTLSVNFTPADTTNYSSVSRDVSINVLKANQTISFNGLGDKTYGNAPFTVGAAGGASGNPVNFSSQTPTVCTVGGATVTIVSAGACTIRASQAGNSDYNAAPDVDRSFTVNKASATVTLSNLSHTFDGAAKSATATTDPAGKTVVITYSQGGSAVGSPTNAGSYDVSATINDANYQGSTSGTLVIGQGEQTITFSALSAKTYGDAPFSVSATGGASGDAVTFGSQTTSVCTVSANTVTILSAGTCAIRASQSGNSNYNAATDVDRSFTVNKASDTVTLSNLSHTFDGTAKSATATTNPADKTVVITYSQGGSAVGSPTNAGSYDVSATINDANYQGSTTGTLVIGQGEQTITFSALSAKTYGDAPFSVSATGGVSGNVVTFGSQTTSVCTVSGDTVTILSAGTCTIRASQSGNSNYNSAPDVDRSFTVNKATPTITWNNPADITYGTALSGTQLNATASVAGSFGYTPPADTVLPAGANQTLSVNFTPADTTNYSSVSNDVSINVLKANQTINFNGLADKTYGNAPFTVGAAGGASGNPVSFSFQTPTVCTVSDATVTIVSAGTCTIRASQAGNSDYNAAPDVDRSFTVNKASATVTLSNLSQTYDGTARSATATTNPADKTVVITYSQGGNGVATPTNVASYDVSAVINDPNYEGSTTGTLVIGKANQTITFGALSDTTYGNADFTVTATSDSGLPVSLAASGNCTVTSTSPGTVQLTGAGSCTVTSSQNGNSTYNEATPVSQSFSIAKGNQTITFGALVDKTFGNADFTVSATASSGLSVSFAASGQCTVTGNTVHLTGAGSCTITASQAGDANYNAAADVQLTFNIAKADQTITFATLTDKTELDPDFAVSATASSNLALSFAADGQCTLSGSTVHLTGIGSCAITASQGGDSNYNPAPSVARTFSVTEVNEAPTAVNDTLSNVAEDSGQRTIAFTELTGNDAKGPANESSQSLIVATVSNPVGGMVSISGSNVLFTPAADYNGAASFQYTVEDDGTTNRAADPKTSAAATASFTITDINDAPAVVNDTLTSIAEDSAPRAIPFADLTGNDPKGAAYESGQTLVVVNANNAVGGTVVLVTGFVVFTPTANYNGAASFEYTVADNGTTNGVADPKSSGTAAVVQFDITEVNDFPTAVADTLPNVAEDSAERTIAFADLTGNDLRGPANESGQTLIVKTVSNPVGVTVSIVEGTVRVTPLPDYNGGASFQYTVEDDGSTNGFVEQRASGPAVVQFNICEVNNDVPVAIRFSEANYSVVESAGWRTITVERTGDTSQAVTVDYASSDYSNPADFMPCSLPGAGFASSRCDFSTAVGTLRFAAGETSKTFNVLISQDNDVEGPETLELTLSNPSGGVEFGVPATAILSITDDATEPATNPVENAIEFVRSQYHDFLNREPDGPGLAFWTDNIEKCNDPARRPAEQTVAQCLDKQRESTAVAFFSSPEFQMTGGFVYRLYKGSLTGAPNYDGGSPGRFPSSLEFMRDVSQVSEGIVVNNQISGAMVEANRNRLAAAFVQRPEFMAKYGGLNNTLYVEELFNTTGIVATDGEKQMLVDALSNGTETRASVLRKVVDGTIVISEGNVQFTSSYGQAFYEQEVQRVFVYMEYVGYLRRNPDAAGFIHWLGKLNQYHGDPFQAEMVRSFILAPEYRNRFGQ